MFVVNYEEHKLIYVVLYQIRERGHLIERLDYCQKCVLVIDRVVKLDVKLDGNREAILDLDKLRHLIVDDVRLTGFVVTSNKQRMCLTN